MSNNAQRNVNLFAIVVGVIIFSVIVYLGYRVSNSPHKIFSISFIAVLAGVLFESFRISENWKTVVYVFVGSLCFSFLCFLPGKHEYEYSFESHLVFWPFWFLVVFAIISSLFNSERTTARLTEGITLLQSISIIYWVFDFGLINIDNWFVWILLGIASCFCLVSFFHALSHFVLSRSARLALSIWSSVIMLVFAIYNIYKVYSQEETAYSKYVSEEILIGVQFFLLGVSAIYIVQNVIMLLGFLPGKGTFFNSRYFKELRELKNDHIERYSHEQTDIGHSIICIITTGLFYWLNIRYEFFPRHTAIWFGFLLFPFLLKLSSLKRRRRHYY